MRLIHVIGTLNPSYGGPVVVLTQLCRGCLDIGQQAEIVTLDAPDDPWADGLPGTVHALGPSWGRYRYSRRLAPWLGAHLGGYDAAIVHGIWQYQSLGVWRSARRSRVPYFVFTHGALDPWFRQNYPLKHAKKLVYWPWAEYRVLRDASAVLFMCEEERRLARQSFGLYQAHEAVVGFGIEGPTGDAHVQKEAFLGQYPHLRDKRMLLFLSRIHQKKGCDLLIRAFADASRLDGGLHLVMAGPDESGWRADLASLAQSLGVERRVTWTGMLTGDSKWGAYQVADAFVLPSHSENFGIVVPEALACGTPVLLTNKVNIWREVADAKAGLVDDDTLSGVTRLLRSWLRLPPDESVRMRQRARACFAQRFEIREAAGRFVATLDQKIQAGAAGGGRPSPG